MAVIDLTGNNDGHQPWTLDTIAAELRGIKDGLAVAEHLFHIARDTGDTATMDAAWGAYEPMRWRVDLLGIDLEKQIADTDRDTDQELLSAARLLSGGDSAEQGILYRLR